MLPKYRNGGVCPRCQRGQIETTDSWQKCNWCGRILWTSQTITEFHLLAPGERFYSAYDPDPEGETHLWIKATDEDRIRLDMPYSMDSYRADLETRFSGHGPGAPCIREHDLRMSGASFTHN